MIERNRTRKHSFVAVRLDLLRHEKFKALPYSARIIFLELLAEASYQNQSTPQTGQQFQESYSLMAKHSGATSATISRALKKLIAEGFLKRLNDPNQLWVQGEDATSEWEVDLDWINR